MREVLDGLQPVFGTSCPIIVYPASGTGGWEAALVNTLSFGDKVLVCETGYFSELWSRMAADLGLSVDVLSGDWRHPPDPDAIAARLVEDTGHEVKAVLIVHNETSTGVVSDVAAVRAAMDSAGHSALLLVDAISSLASMEYSHDGWGVDVTVAGSQKGLMLPPGLSFNAISHKALAASEQARLPRSYWAWQPMLASNSEGFTPYTPATNLLYGLREAITMLAEEGMDHVYARHARHAEATRCAVRGWGLEIFCADPAAHSSTLTAVALPENHNSDKLRDIILNGFNLSLGGGLGRLKGRVFRIGHLGDLNDVMLLGALAGVELGLAAAGVPAAGQGVQAAIRYLESAVSTTA